MVFSKTWKELTLSWWILHLILIFHSGISGHTGQTDPVNWLSVIGNYKYDRDQCWRHVSLQVEFMNEITEQAIVCNFQIFFEIPNEDYNVCYLFANPVRYVSVEHLMMDCDQLLSLKLVGDAQLGSNAASFQNSPNLDATFVAFAAALSGSWKVVAFDTFVADTSRSAEGRGMKSLLDDLDLLRLDTTASHYVEQRIFPSQLFRDDSRRRELTRQFMHRYNEYLALRSFETASNSTTPIRSHHTTMSHIERATPLRVLFVRPGWKPPPEAVGRIDLGCDFGCDCHDVVLDGSFPNPASMFDRFVPFIHRMRDGKHMSMEFFYPTHLHGYGVCGSFNSSGYRISSSSSNNSTKCGRNRNLLHRNNSCDGYRFHTHEDIGIADPYLFYHLEEAEWLHSVDQLVSGEWVQNQHVSRELRTLNKDGTTINSTNVELLAKVIDAALTLIDFFNSFDVIIYQTERFVRPAETNVYANLMFLAHRAKLVRYVSAVDAFYVEFPEWAPCDAIITDSQSYQREVWYHVSVALDVPVMVIPPYLPPLAVETHALELTQTRVPEKATTDAEYNIIFLGLTSPHYSPGVFVRMASLIINSCQPGSYLNSPDNFRVFCEPVLQFKKQVRLRFTMIAVGSIYPSIFTLLRLHNISDFFNVIHTDTIQQVVETLTTLASPFAVNEHLQRTIVVDPSPSRGLHSSLYPLATYLGFPIIRFASSSGNEFLLEGQSVAVPQTRIFELAKRVVSLIESEELERIKPSQNLRKKMIELFDPSISAIATEVFVYHLVYGHRARNNILNVVGHGGSGGARKEQPLSVTFSNVENIKSQVAAAFSTLHPHVFEPPPDFSPSQTHVWYEADDEDALDFAHKEIDPAFTKSCFEWDSYGVVGRLLPRLNTKVRVKHIPELESQQQAHLAVVNLNGNPTEGRVDLSISRRHRILCIVYTYSARHSNVFAQLHTFGKRCDGFVSFSDVSDPSIHAVRLHMELEGGESYRNMWRKVQCMWAYVAQHFMRVDNDDHDGNGKDKYDWFMMMGDDTYVSVPNLRSFLQSFDEVYQREPLYLGRQQRQSLDRIYNGGGAGYVLNSKALSIFVANIFSNPLCFTTKKHSTEDVLISVCLESLGIKAVDTRQLIDFKRGVWAERFHWKTPTEEYLGFGFQYRKTSGLELRSGYDCCANESISFHPIPPENMYCLDLLWTL